MGPCSPAPWDGAEELPIAVETFRAIVEGTFVKGLDRRARRKVLTFALERLMGS